MKSSYTLKSVLLLLSFLIIFPVAAIAQRPLRVGNQIAVTGWLDDSHYLLRTLDTDNQTVFRSIDIKTGKGVPAPMVKTPMEIISESLPSGIFVSANDVISPDSKSVLITMNNDLYFFKIGDKGLRQLTMDKNPEVNSRFSPDGSKIAYTRNKDLYVFDLVNNKEIRLTTDASERVYNGYASWVYYEEILGRQSKYAAFWWSPDGKKIAYLRSDETDVPVFTLNRLDEADGVHGLIEETPYPKPGDPNPKVKMGITDISTAKTTWIRTDYSVDQYIAWPFWTPDSKKIAVQIVNRDQNELKIILADPATGDFKNIYTETRKTWVEFREDIYTMNNGSGFIIRSNKNDWDNLYYYGWDGRLISQITDLSFSVNSIDKVDEELKMVYFSATGPESTDMHGFSAGMDGKNLTRITKGEGTHTLSISPGGTYFIDTWSSISSAGSIIAYDKRGKQLKEIHRFEQPEYDPASQSKAEFVRIKTSDGLFSMPAIITYPLFFDPSKEYPVIFTIYGGPDSKNVNNKWQGTTPSWYAQNGIITFAVDHRGSGHFGKKGLDYMYRCLGKWEILDYTDAVRWLREKPYVDGTRMGMTGGSYGGYMTCLALTKGADYWTHGIANYSVTDYRLYDNVYTERFMDTPQDNPEGYKDGSALTWVKNYKGKLYITHGDMDDNVHMQNSIYLISKLQDEGKSFEFMLYPGGRHGWGGSKAMHLRSEANKFWMRNFFGK